MFRESLMQKRDLWETVLWVRVMQKWDLGDLGAIREVSEHQLEGTCFHDGRSLDLQWWERDDWALLQALFSFPGPKSRQILQRQELRC